MAFPVFDLWMPIEIHWRVRAAARERRMLVGRFIRQGLAWYWTYGLMGPKIDPMDKGRIVKIRCQVDRQIMAEVAKAAGIFQGRYLLDGEVPLVKYKKFTAEWLIWNAMNDYTSYLGWTPERTEEANKIFADEATMHLRGVQAKMKKLRGNHGTDERVDA